MADPINLANAWSVAKSMRIPPSAQLGIEDPFTAYCLDQAVARWGTHFDAALAEAAGDPKTAERKQQQVVRRWIPTERRYAELRS